MNRKKVLLLVSMLEALFFFMMTVLYFQGTIKFMTFLIAITTVSGIFSILLLIAIRKLPPM